MSVEFILRLIGMIVFAIVGIFWGLNVGNNIQSANIKDLFVPEV